MLHRVSWKATSPGNGKTRGRVLFAGVRDRHSHDPDLVGPQRRQNDHDLHACSEARCSWCSFAAGQADASLVSTAEEFQITLLKKPKT